MQLPALEHWPSTKPVIDKPQPEIADFLFKSFYFSQGSSEVQDILLAYGNSYFDHALEEVDIPLLIDSVAKRSLAWIRRGPHERSTESNQSIVEQVENFQRKLFDTSLLPLDGIPLNFTKQLDSLKDFTAFKLIQRDGDFIVSRRNGRKERSSDKTGPYHARQLSHAVFYGIMLTSTGSPAFDTIFAGIHDDVANNLSAREGGLLSNDIVSAHLSDRPQDREALAAHVYTCEYCWSTVE